MAPERIPWHSMEEILPSIESLWTRAARRGRFSLQILHLGARPNIRDLGPLLDADIVVASFLSPSVFWTLWALRAKLSVKIPFFVHTHGEGTVGFTRVRELAATFAPGDIFVCASRAEAASVRATFPRAHAVVCPFPIQSITPSRLAVPKANDDSHRDDGIHFVYAGRISEQKNVHTLLLALSILREREPRMRWTLDLFGQEDRWGSPNMGFRMKGYERYLRRLARELAFDDRVRWRGFVPRGRLDATLRARPHVFVSPTLHSDEDFGVAALKSLAAGYPAVLSAWGGHFDLARRFAGRARLVPAYASAIGPFIDAGELARALARPWPARSTPARSSHSEDDSANRLATLARRAHPVSGSLLASANARALWSRAARLPQPVLKPPFEPRHYPERVFTGYDDPLAAPFFAAYGARPRSSGPFERAGLVPWAHKSGRWLIIRDPHRGAFRIPLRRAGAQGLFREGIIFTP